MFDPHPISQKLPDEWLWHMRRGDFARAWEISDRILHARAGADTSHLPRHLQSIWKGQSLDGARVLVRCYHGLGDTIQFIRYLPLVKARAREVIVWMQPALIPLLQSAAGVDRVLPLHDGSPDVDYDVDVEIMELPYVFRTAANEVPANVPYVRVAAERLSRELGPAVGIVWRAGDWAEHRSIPFALLEPLVRIPATWYVLQGDPGLQERPPDFGIVRGASEIVEAARAIAGLDLLITIDSMAAHLGGALGTRVWTLLAADADWRWMMDRDDSPWYPTMKLFRQQRRSDWTGVVARAADELEEFI